MYISQPHEFLKDKIHSSNFKVKTSNGQRHDDDEYQED